MSESGDSSDDASASGSSVESSASVPQVPPSMLRFSDHFRQHGAELLEKVQEYAKAYRLQHVTDNDHSEFQAPNTEQEKDKLEKGEHEGVPSNVSTTAITTAPSITDTISSVRKKNEKNHVAKLENKLNDMGKKLDKVLQLVGTGSIHKENDLDKANVGAKSYTPDIPDSGNPGLVEKVTKQQETIEQLLLKIQETQNKVDRLTEQNEFEMLVAEEDSMDDIGTSFLKTSFRPQGGETGNIGGKELSGGENEHPDDRAERLKEKVQQANFG
mmetsp:Transcript_26191/g.42383  ORF Transcript_26191/g.42383 Transcript_26191/m.42383 type:complete len:271 (+) Transcript_26191:318-1130(+)